MRAKFLWAAAASLLAGWAAGCTTLSNESLTEATQAWGAFALDDADEPGDVDVDDAEDSDEGAAAPTLPDFGAAVFTQPMRIDHPYFPVAAGAKWTYSGQAADGAAEMVLLEVLDESRQVLGVACRVVRDRVFVGGIVVEDTRDFFAQDDAGNVWYMGEEVNNFEYDAAGGLVNVTHEGAWEAGKDVAGVGAVARPGLQMRAAPRPGDAYYQEFYEGEAEDAAEIIAVDAVVTLSDGRRLVCLKVREFTRLDPDSVADKYYAPALGLVAEESVPGGARVELGSGP